MRIATDPWMPTPRTFLPLSRSVDMPQMVGELVGTGGLRKKDIIERCFNEEDAHVILCVPLSKFGCLDRIIWHYTRNGL